MFLVFKKGANFPTEPVKRLDPYTPRFPYGRKSHGVTAREVKNPDGDGLKKYILPYNADPKDLHVSALRMGEVARIFDWIVSERLMFLRNTCYRGDGGERCL